MIDPTKIRVGDEVTVRAIVAREDGGLIKLTEDWFNASEIVSHTPAPRPFVVGGKVRHRRDDLWKMTVRAECDGWLWLKNEAGFLTVNKDNWEPCD